MKLTWLYLLLAAALVYYGFRFWNIDYPPVAHQTAVGCWVVAGVLVLTEFLLWRKSKRKGQL